MGCLSRIGDEQEKPQRVTVNERPEALASNTAETSESPDQGLHITQYNTHRYEKTRFHENTLSDRISTFTALKTQRHVLIYNSLRSDWLRVPVNRLFALQRDKNRTCHQDRNTKIWCGSAPNIHVGSLNTESPHCPHKASRLECFV